MKLQTGDIGFVDNGINGSIISKIIKWFMGSRWSHSFMVLEQFEDDYLIIETSSFEVVISYLSKYLDGRPIEFFRDETIYLTETPFIKDKSLKLVGTGYGYLKLVGLGVRRLMMKIGLCNHFVIFKSQLVCCDVPIQIHKNLQSRLGKHFNNETVMDTEELYLAVKSITTHLKK